MTPNELLGALVSFALTLAVLSYLAGDNPLYRIAIHLFVGVAAGYAVIITYYNIIYPRLIVPLLAADLANLGQLATSLIVLAAGLLLLLKTVRVASRIGTLVVAFLVGVGVATAIGGAVTGTLFPQTEATMVSMLPQTAGGLDVEAAVEAVVILIGTLATLGYFWYGGRGEPGRPADRPALVKPVAFIGQIFIGTAFGAMYAGALAASLAFFSQSVADLWAVAALFLGTR